MFPEDWSLLEWVTVTLFHILMVIFHLLLIAAIFSKLTPLSENGLRGDLISLTEQTGHFA
jgi:hypothetical protein